MEPEQDEIDESDETPSVPDPEKTKKRIISFLRAMGLTTVVAGVVGSLGLLFIEGGHSPLILLILFVGWVASPFLALLVANVFSKRWSVPTRVTLYFLELIITVAALIGYSGVLTPPGVRPAAVFLLVPLISWLLIAIIIPI